jgi:hypothetical protein
MPPLLIIGSPRSGTTFLARMVNRFLDVHVCRDNGTILRFLRHLRRYEPLTDDRNLRRLISHLYRDFYFRTRVRERGLDLTEDQLFARVERRDYAGLVDAAFSAVAATHGKKAFGYKRASFGRSGPGGVDALFPGAGCVHVIRDARDVVLSMRTSTQALLERSWHFGALDWVAHVEAGRRIGADLGPGRYLELRYEDLMRNPAAVLSALLLFHGRGDDTDARLEKIHAEAPDLIKQGNTEKWRTAMPARAIRTVERAAGRVLAHLGYPVQNPDVVDAPIAPVEMAWLRVDRVWRNLVQTQTGALARYWLEVTRTGQRARLKSSREPRDRRPE